MFQIVEQHFYYTVKTTSNKYFPNAIYANHDAKFSPAAARKAHFTNKNFNGGENFY